MKAAWDRAEVAGQAVPERVLADAIRMLAVDAVERAGSGHPGMPMGMAEIALVLWSRFLRHDPANPLWPDRDRVVVSNGHGSMLLYAMLHLTGYDLPVGELKRFRRAGSRAPGHPEHGLTPGVETTTGPLGQGLANAVGMALAEKLLASEFNRPGHRIVDHHTYVLLGDGCLMEGISHEAASLAGALGLGKLVCLWDDNGISIDGPVSGWFRDDTARRFEAYGWHVVAGVDGHDPAAIAAALEAARAAPDRPSLVCCRTVIGRGSPGKAGSAAVHGAPLGAAEADATRAHLGWRHPPFEIPAEVYAALDARPRGAALAAAWEERLSAYARDFPALAAELRRRLAGDPPASLEPALSRALAEADSAALPAATRKASQQAIEAIAREMPELLGGSADLTHSNLTIWKGARPVARGGGGNYVHFGVREHAMCAALNGVALHGGFVPFGGTFLAFSDYARPAIRMAALMKVRTVLVLTHDSIGVGEDGPTHQPVEHAASLRLVPNLDVWRPCDAVETIAAWRSAVLRRDGPTALLLSRQGLPAQRRDPAALAHVERGGYVLAEAEGGSPQAVLVATGSEVDLALRARSLLAAAGIRVRVVSMPSTSVFDRQSAPYRASVLPRGIPRVAVEAGSSDAWRKYVGLEGSVVGVDGFGESASAEDLFRRFGLAPECVADAVRRVLRSNAG